MNFPGDKVHHIVFGFGRLLLPWFDGTWWMYVRGMSGTIVRRGVRLVDVMQFHNCRRSGG